MNERILPQGKPAEKSSSFVPGRPGLLQRKCACGGTPGVDGECADCRAKRLSGLQRGPKQVPSDRTEPSEGPADVHEVLASPGQPLDAATRAFMEPRFGHDFSQVGVHADTKAPDSAAAIAPSQSGRPLDPATRARMEARFGHNFDHVRVHANAASAGAAARWNARAFTLNRNIYFGASYEQSSPAGEALLAHELTHVVQADAADSHPARPASSVDALELEARHVATAFRLGTAVPPLRGLARGLATPLREPDDPGVPTFGWLQSDPSTGQVAPAQIVDRVELREINGKWYEMPLGQRGKGLQRGKKLATGRYDFVVQDGRTFASRHSHGSASAGGRVQYAGQIHFDKPGALSEWTPASGSYRPAGSFAKQAGLPADKFRPLPPGGKVQLPVIQEGSRGGGSAQPKPSPAAPVDKPKVSPPTKAAPVAPKAPPTAKVPAVPTPPAAAKVAPATPKPPAKLPAAAKIDIPQVKTTPKHVPKPRPGLGSVAKWGKVSPFDAAMQYLDLHAPHFAALADVKQRAAIVKNLLSRVEGLERGARELRKAIDALQVAEWELPTYPLQTYEETGEFLIGADELAYVEKYLQAAARIANDAMAARSELHRAIEGWDAARAQAEKTSDFTRQAAMEAVIKLQLRFSNEGGDFRAYLVKSYEDAGRVENWARMKQYHAADILGKWVPQWYTPPAP